MAEGTSYGPLSWVADTDPGFQMPLVAAVRFLTSLVSLFILGLAGYFLWTWYEGTLVSRPDGILVRVRDDWRLWSALAFIAWSFLGRFLITPLLAGRDQRPSRVERENGRILAGSSGSSLYVETHGPAGAPTIIFVHGWGLDSTVWSYAKRDLAGRFRLILWDLPGLGQSKPAHGDKVSLESFAHDLGGLIEFAGRPVVLVGHSIGGMTIQTLIKTKPECLDRVSGIVLLNTTYTNPLHTMILSDLVLALRKPLIEPLMRLTIWLRPLVWASQWQSYMSGSAHLAHRVGFGKFVTRSQLNHSALLATRNSPGVQAKGDLAMFRWDATGAAAAYDGPVLVVGGDCDLVTKLEASEDIAAAAGGRLETIAGVNHMGFLERAELYNGLIGDFASVALARADHQAGRESLTAPELRPA